MNKPLSKLITILISIVLLILFLFKFRLKELDNIVSGKENVVLYMDRYQSDRFWDSEKERGFLKTKYILKNNDSLISSFYVLEGDQLYRHPYIEKVTKDSIFLRHYFGGDILIGFPLYDDKCTIENAKFIFLFRADSTYKEELISWMKKSYVSSPSK